MANWLKLRIILPADSKFNSPIFAVAKKDGGSAGHKISRPLMPTVDWPTTS